MLIAGCDIGSETHYIRTIDVRGRKLSQGAFEFSNTSEGFENAFKFVLVGIVNTAVGTAVIFIFYNIFHANYWLSSAMNYVIGRIVSYFLNKYFTFQNSEKSVRQIVKFIVNITVCYLFAYGIAKPLVRFVLSDCAVAVQENVAMLVGMCIFVGLNYLGQKFIVFKD